MTSTITAAPFFRYEVELSERGGAPSTCCVLYCSTDQVSVTRLADQLNALAEDRMIPDRLYLMGRESSLDSLRAAATHDRIVEMLPQATRFHQTPALEVLTFDSRGAVRSWSEEPAVNERVWRDSEGTALLQAGLRTIMRERGVVLQTNGYHFAKPSRRHSDRFIRTANALRYGSEVSFIAANLLHLLPQGDFDRVYTDTSSINTVAYALRDHLRAFDDKPHEFTIDSFGSYSGIDGDFNLSGGERALVLISASTSGGLVDKIARRQHIEESRIITLCYVGSIELSNVLCDLTSREEGASDHALSGLHPPFPNWDADNCPKCANGSSLVVISGDQFLPASPSISMEIVKQAHAPKWLNSISEQLTGLGVIRCHVGTRIDSEPRSLYLDFLPVVRLAQRLIDPAHQPRSEQERLAMQIRRRILRDVPAGTQWIVHSDDDASRGLAELAGAHLEAIVGPLPQGRIVNARELIASPESFDLHGLVLVVASAVVSGRSITTVSQALRVAHGDNPIAYLILAARTPNRARMKDVRNNLAYGNGRFDEHHVSTLLEMALPDDRDTISSPWSAETQLWKKLRDGVEDPDAMPERMAWLNDRIELLEDGMGLDGNGLTNNLFLKNWVESGDLRLQPNFAFWDFEYASENVAQSEIFFVATSILHNMRVELNLLQSGAHEHNWTVLDPANLARFNDPVIQAALLRSASPHELDYTGQREFSRDMATVISPLIASWEKPDGGAAAEILLALVTGRLKLDGRDLVPLQDILDPDSVPEPLSSLAEALRTIG